MATEIKNLLAGYEIKVQKSRRTEYGDMLDKFLEELNPTRKEHNMPLMTHARLAVTLQKAGIHPNHFYIFYQQCKKARCFSSFFWYLVRIKQKERGA